MLASVRLVWSGYVHHEYMVTSYIVAVAFRQLAMLARKAKRRPPARKQNSAVYLLGLGVLFGSWGSGYMF